MSEKNTPGMDELQRPVEELPAEQAERAEGGLVPAVNVALCDGSVRLADGSVRLADGSVRKIADGSV